MRATTPLILPLTLLSLLLLVLLEFPVAPALAGPKPETYWQVDDVRPGMKGIGRTTMKGTKLEEFQAEVLGTLKNTSPGRDMVLCRLSGLDLEKTGVIAGMSGSPIYIEGKLLGAVAYAWAFGKEPIAGVTPFCQMHGFVESYERRDLVEQGKPTRVGLKAPLHIGGATIDSVTVSPDWNAPEATATDSMWMMPLRTPVATTGFTAHSLSLLRERFHTSGLVPMQGGGASAKIVEDEKDTPLQAGGPLVVAMVTGDFDMSGIGTVTHIEKTTGRVYGWGHPFMGLGTCEFPLMTGYIHTIYPRQSVSFKLGSPLRTVGVINADVSTGIAGWLGRKPEMLPVRMNVTREPEGTTRTFNVEIARQRSMLAPLTYSVLTNSVDMEGELPEELTAELTAKIEVEDQGPIVIHDTFSGSSFSGGRAPMALYNQIASVVGLMTYNTYKPVRINRIECETRIMPGRRTADIEAIELDSDVLSPGETLKATLFIRPFKGLRQRLPVSLKLPADLPEGNYTAIVCDDLTNARFELRDNPNLSSPQNLDQVFEALRVQTAAKRTNIVVRVPINAVGVALSGKSLPNLPPSMVQILGSSRRTGAQTMGGALVSRKSTDWVFQGSESVHFTVTKNKKVLAD
jgi:hypothetical protein